MTKVTEHNAAYTFLEFLDDLTTRVIETHDLEQSLVVCLPTGAEVALKIVVLGVAVSEGIEEALH